MLILRSNVRVYHSHKLLLQYLVVVVVYYLQDLVQSFSRGEGGILEDMCYERRDDEPRPVWTSLPIAH